MRFHVGVPLMVAAALALVGCGASARPGEKATASTGAAGAATSTAASATATDGLSASATSASDQVHGPPEADGCPVLPHEFNLCANAWGAVVNLDGGQYYLTLAFSSDGTATWICGDGLEGDGTWRLDGSDAVVVRFARSAPPSVASELRLAVEEVERTCGPDSTLYTYDSLVSQEPTFQLAPEVC